MGVIAAVLIICICGMYKLASFYSMFTLRDNAISTQILNLKDSIFSFSQNNSHDAAATSLTMQVTQHLKNTSFNQSELNPKRQTQNPDNVTTTSHTMTQETQDLKSAPVNNSDLNQTQNSNDVTAATAHTAKQNNTSLKSHNYSNSRFVLCQSYWEQQTNSIINLFSFQKWANVSGNPKVVEPFAIGSVLKFPDSVLQKHEFTKALRFSSYFDLDYWTKETAKLGIEPLVTWETFVKYANRKLILAVPAYDAAPGGIYVDDEINKNSGCRTTIDKFHHSTDSLLKFLHFEVIKTVCYAYWKSNNRPIKDVNSYLISDDNATIWFGLWRGIEKGPPGMHTGRMPISDTTLQRSYGGIHKILAMVRASPKILFDSKKYLQTVLKVGFREYTAIHIRTVGVMAEKLRGGHSKARLETFQYFTKCVVKLNDILDKSGSTIYYLTTDLGRFGDRTAYEPDDRNSAKLLQQLLQAVYGNKTIDVYEKEFITAANGVEDRGYIASVQKTIAINAKCLIVMGGFSTFQNSIIVNYKHSIQPICIKYVCHQA